MRQFILRAVNLALILAIGVCYQQRALPRAAEVEEYNQQVAEAEALAEEYAAMEAAALNQAAEDEAESGYQDGTYTGAGTGFGGEITLSVTIENGEITGVELVSAPGEDSSYLSQAETLLDDIVNAQSADLDTVSGATFSSTGILEAAQNALEEASQ
ncbi:MAG: FMN-binding protein [Clostridiales bacterium]|nr:FMN-binding protein [Clostridiales bacterium]